MDNALLSWIALIGAIGGPMSGIAVAIIASRRSRKERLSGIAVEDKNLDIRERDADTHYWSALVEGFSEQLASVRNSHNDLEHRYSNLEQKHDALEARFNSKVQREQEMMAHILALETLVPNPPGPPPRPWV